MSSKKVKLLGQRALISFRVLTSNIKMRFPGLLSAIVFQFNSIGQKWNYILTGIFKIMLWILSHVLHFYLFCLFFGNCLIISFDHCMCYLSIRVASPWLYLLQILLPICCLLFNFQHCSTYPSRKLLVNYDERIGKLERKFVL